MNEQARHAASRRCEAIGALTVGGRVVGQIRCELDAGHEIVKTLNSGFPDEWFSGKPHRATLEWTPEREPDLDLFDPHETFDIEVPIPKPYPPTLEP
jgi:hypothetical protein